MKRSPFLLSPTPLFLLFFLGYCPWLSSLLTISSLSNLFMLVTHPVTHALLSSSQTFFFGGGGWVQFSRSVVLTPFDPMDCSMPGFPVHHQLPELTQTHVHRVGDAIQPSHPLLFPSPPTFNLSQHQGLSSESVLHITWSKYWSFSISPSNDYSGLISFGKLTGVTSLLSKGLSRVFSNTTVQRHQFFSTQLSQWREMQKCKMVVWGGLTNTCEKKRS